jgi:LmbE family N-acetylglucosaminyl deacetylase
MAVLAHPDDESLGCGGTLAKYAAEGVEVSLVIATRGQSGRYKGHGQPPEHPGRVALARIREDELRAAASALGVRDPVLLDHEDKDLDRAEPRRVIRQIAFELRRVRPQVVITFPPDGAYGHPDHIAISQFTTAAVVAAADPAFQVDAVGLPHAPHVVEKLYFMAWPAAVWTLYQHAFHEVVTRVDDSERRVVSWPEWAITTEIDARAYAGTVWNAVRCHESQIGSYPNVQQLSAEEHATLWGRQCFYRAMSLVNAGRRRETDLFEGIRERTPR